MPISIRRTDPAIDAQVTADLHGLPTGRITARDTAAHIFTADIHELRAWINALGGYVTRQRAGGAVTLWTLHTHTELRSDGSSTPVLVHALSLAGEDIHPDITEAVA
ncbi:hypothetical protein [Streptomyces olivochromogenes]|uniref:Uncharacterized protein n=1 Tax=Streptomyces olivochromogenes TaxID=1963 RepID=A0A250VSP7_STROL|nr:hypothetical protein [Streptomyces olivochromogenes]KUN38188.1 hypothetical protein AQJ27_44600 [Streptomyces olivochromogenes]GAX57237.1 hypothetical protein SO3561_08807 [Streptomyces olivochromogenes]